MADTPSIITPDFTDTVNQQVFVEPLNGPANPKTYLDRFPDEVYNKGVDSRLSKLIYTLLGPAGVGWLHKNYLDARLAISEYGVDLFDLDRFFGDPLRFSRILEEQYDEDPSGLLPRDKWEEIKAKDSAYRARALNYVKGLRAGNTPVGIRLVSEAGLGHGVQVVENYLALFDRFTDEPLGLPFMGATRSCDEFIILPRRELAQSEIQQISILGIPDGGTFTLGFRDKITESLSYTADRETIRLALSAIPEIGDGNVEVLGGPLPDHPIQIFFQRGLANRDAPELVMTSGITGLDVHAFIETIRGGVDGTDELGTIGPSDQHSLQVALDYLRPQTSIVSYTQASGVKQRNLWNSSFSSSAFAEVVRYVTGRSDISWPALDAIHWIEAGVEHQARRTHSDTQHHYTAFHNVLSCTAYTDQIEDDPQPNEHLGAYSSYQSALFPPLIATDNARIGTFALADYSEPLVVTSQTDAGTGLINGIYPIDYEALPGISQPQYRNNQFWSSLERSTGTDFLEVDLGTVQAVNYLTFEVLRKPINIGIDFDLLDAGTERVFNSATIADRSNPTVSYEPSFLNPWETIVLNVTDPLGDMIFTRYIRISFSRRLDTNSPFVSGSQILASSVEARNLRIGRLVTP